MAAPRRGQLRQALSEEINDQYLGALRLEPGARLYSEVIDFHYSPTDLKVTHNPRFRKNDTAKTRSVKPEYLGTPPPMYSIRLFFNDLGAHDLPPLYKSAFTTTGLLRDPAAGRDLLNKTGASTYGMVGSEWVPVWEAEYHYRGTDQDVPNPLSGQPKRKTVEESLFFLEKWIGPQGLTPKEGIPPRPVEILGITDYVIIAVIKKYQAKITNWEKHTSRPIRAMVSLEFQEYTNTKGHTIRMNYTGRRFYEYIKELKVQPNDQISAQQEALVRGDTGATITKVPAITKSIK